MSDSTDSKAALTALARHLAARRGAILRNWQRSIEADPELTTPAALPHTQVNDHIPQVLDAFERRLQARDPIEKEVAFEDQKSGAAEHGLHRWQQGYRQHEAIREWAHLQYCVLNELEDYALAHPSLQVTVMPIARRALLRLCGEGVCQSASSYERLQRTEAASRVRELEWALLQLQRLERQRAESWREAAHDLRGTVGVVSTASSALLAQPVDDPRRAATSRMLQRSVESLRALLTDMMDLARLEAGQEQLRIARFDAAALLRAYCDTVRPLAQERELCLSAEGPSRLWVGGCCVSRTPGRVSARSHPRRRSKMPCSRRLQKRSRWCPVQIPCRRRPSDHSPMPTVRARVAVKASDSPSSSACASCSMRASRWRPRPVRAPPFG